MALIKPFPTDRVFMLNHGISLPDYFRGSAGITLSACVDAETTIGEMLEGIESDWNERDITYDCEHHEIEEEKVSAFFADWLSTCREENELSKLLDPGLGNDECYQYFSIEFN